MLGGIADRRAAAQGATGVARPVGHIAEETLIVLVNLLLVALARPHLAITVCLAQCL